VTPLTWSLEFVGLAIRNLLGYPLRSFLTTLGVVFGIGSVVTMLALGKGAEQEILREIDRLGITNVILESVKPPDSGSAGTERSWVSSYGLTFKDLRQIEETVPGVLRVLPVHSYTERATYLAKEEHVEVIGVKPAHFDVAKLRVAKGGRGVEEADEQARRPVCVVHLQLLRSLGWYGDPLGFSLRAGDQVYEVVGVLADDEFQGVMRRALTSPERSENEIYVPYSTVLTRIGTMSISRGSGSFQATDVELNRIIVESESQAHVLPVARMLRAVLEKLHEQRDYEIVVPLELLEQKRKTQEVFDYALLLIAGISLLVGGIGIANIMLATVTERTREIGVRRAIGAKRMHVVGQFLTETITLSTAGGVLGILAGLAGIGFVRWWRGWTLEFSWDVALVAIAVSFVVGVLSGIFPAWRASRLDPIQALRYE
jgi:putative ABC transport system permease protein